MREKQLNIVIWIMLYALASLAIPVLPTIGPLYYVVLSGMVVYILFRRQDECDLRVVFVLIACVLSILLNNPPALFKSWERLGLFFLMLVVTSPLVQNEYINEFRLKLFNRVVWLAVGVSLLSCLAYFVGVDLTVKPKGAIDLFFGGVAGNSMLLAVCAGISLLYGVNRLLNKSCPKRHRNWYFIGMFFLVLASFLCLLLSGSRGAALSTIISLLFLFYKRNRQQFSKFLIYISTFLVFTVASFPLWESYTEALVVKQKGNDVSGSATASRDSKWEARLDEFASSPVFGVGFSAVDLKHSADYLVEGGIVETGTSWGGVLSMIGLLGFLPFLILFADSLWFLFLDNAHPYFSGLLASIICWFSVHMVVEGYALAGGSFLCFVLWLTIGAASAYRAKVENQKESEVEYEVAV